MDFACSSVVICAVSVCTCVSVERMCDATPTGVVRFFIYKSFSGRAISNIITRPIISITRRIGSQCRVAAVICKLQKITISSKC